MDLKGKTVVLTGASTGIGAATALELSRAGCNLVLTSRRPEKLEALASTLPGPSVLLAADIAEAGTPEQLLALAKEGFPIPRRSGSGCGRKWAGKAGW